jgi:hypothetical protein
MREQTYGGSRKNLRPKDKTPVQTLHATSPHSAAQSRRACMFIAGARPNIKCLKPN